VWFLKERLQSCAVYPAFNKGHFSGGIAWRQAKIVHAGEDFILVQRVQAGPDGIESSWVGILKDCDRSGAIVWISTVIGRRVRRARHGGAKAVAPAANDYSRSAPLAHPRYVSSRG
jgi:hypothetical protein